MLRTKRTTSADPGFVDLVSHLDAYLAEIDGEDHSYYAQFNNIDVLQHCIIVSQGDRPMGCGAMKEFDELSMEIKRMFTLPQSRGMGIATTVLKELEVWAKELGYQKCVLETGRRQPEAIALYQKAGYLQTENYGQYIGMDNSVCFQKEL